MAVSLSDSCELRFRGFRETRPMDLLSSFSLGQLAGRFQYLSEGPCASSNSASLDSSSLAFFQPALLFELDVAMPNVRHVRPGHVSGIRVPGPWDCLF